jgi:lysophospholipase L1-like esterase
VSLFSLSNAIVSGDWSAQSKRTGNLLRDVAISRLMTAGFETVSHIGLEYGPNDFRYDSPIGSDSETCRETFKGALNYSIRTLLAGYPKIRVFLITPWWMPTFDDRDSDQYPNGAGFFLREYVDAMLQVADLNRIPCLDLWSTSGVSKFNYREFTIDGVHLNDAGVIRRADMIASFMRSVY